MRMASRLPKDLYQLLFTTASLLWPLSSAGQTTEPGAQGSANEPSPTASSRGAAAEALFQQGVAASERGQLDVACAKFEASQGLDVAVGTLLYLADCYERTGRLASAWARFREAASLAQAQSMAERARVAGVRAEALEPKLSHVTIVVATPERQPPQLTVTLDGTPVQPASWGAALPVDPAVLRLRASAPGYVTYERPVDVSSTAPAQVRIDVPLLTRAPAEPALPPSQPRHQTTSLARPFGIAATAVGAAGLATAGVLALLAKNKNDDSLEHCPVDPSHCTSEGVTLRDQAGKLADFATVSAVFGGALAITGVVLLVTSAPSTPRESASVRFTPVLGPRAAGLQAGGSF
jgi:serine/threonine-protein kinase